METFQAERIIDAVTDWAIERDDIRAMALVGSWARGNPRSGSDLDLLLLTDLVEVYRVTQHWSYVVDFNSAGFRFQSSNSSTYGVVWSLNIRLLPAAGVELTFANCSWAKTSPVDGGTRRIVNDAFRILFDKDVILANLVDAVRSG